MPQLGHLELLFNTYSKSFCLPFLSRGYCGDYWWTWILCSVN